MSSLREHIERCEHAVDEPDWAGLREPASWKERAIAAEARLDAMTVEDRLRRTGVVKGKVVEVEPFYEQRLVGPWTVVPEGDGNV